MPTDRSLWVEDKYALRCRDCGEKFTMFRRRHHCRRCGQVFCYECLYDSTSSTSPHVSGSPQSFVDNFYEWFAPSPTRTTRPSSDSGSGRPFAAANATTALPSSPLSSSPVLVPSGIIVDEDVRAELAMRLCRRCAATILANAERESLASSQVAFRPASNGSASGTATHNNNNNSTNVSNSNVHNVPAAQQLLLSPTLSSAAAVAAMAVSAASPLSPSLSRTGSPLRPTPAAPLSDTSLPSPLALTSTINTNRSSLSASGEPHQLSQHGAGRIIQSGEENKDEEEVIAEEPWRAWQHAETTEEREVTYSVARVPPRVQATMSQWWAAHQTKMEATQRERKLSVNGCIADADHQLVQAGAVIHRLSDPITFAASFHVRGDHEACEADGRVSDRWACPGSAASHEQTELSENENAFLTSFSTACTAHLTHRLRASVEAAFPGTPAPHLCQHLAAMAWYVVQRTAVALGTAVEEHVAFFSVPRSAAATATTAAAAAVSNASARAAQAIIYPGLICPQRLPSKRTMTPCERPRVLLLAGHLSYAAQPTEDLVDYVRSYGGYLDKLYQRLVVWSPDVVVVEGGMHHYLRERIEAEGGQMRLLLNVGRDFLLQLAWCLRATIIADLQYVGVADLATTAPMGECLRFEELELAEEQRFCAFAGFSDVCFHTVEFRGGPSFTLEEETTSTRSTHRTERNSNGKRRLGRNAASREEEPVSNCWKGLEQLGREAVTAAYHVAMQSHWVTALLRFSLGHSTFAADAAAAVTATEPAAEFTADLTLNCGCQYAPEVLSACQSAGASASLVRDTLVLNVVFMDHLFENTSGNSNNNTTNANTNNNNNNNNSSANGGSHSSGGVSGFKGAAIGGTASSLTRARSSDLAVDTSLPPSRPSSTRASRSDLPGLMAPGLSSTAAAPSPPVLQRQESTAAAAAAAAAQAYAVVQQKMALSFYGGSDDSLHTFLLARCTAPETQLLYLHGSHRVRVTATRVAWKLPVTGSGGSGSNGGTRGSRAGDTGAAAATEATRDVALEEAQKVAFLLVAMRLNAARAFAPAELADAAATNAWLTSLQGHFSLRITSDVASNQSAASPSSSHGAAASTLEDVDVTVPVCSAHMLNLSTAAFLEWVLYGWMPRLQSLSESEQQQQHCLRLVFTFHPDAASAAPRAFASTKPASPAAAAMSLFDKNTVTLVIDPVPILRIEYPPALLPSPPVLSDAGWPGDASTMDIWYAAHDAEELEKTITGFFLALNAARNSTAATAATTVADQNPANAASSSPQQQPQQSPPSPPAAEKNAALFTQLHDRARLAVEALQETRTRGEAEVALFLRPLRQHLIPTLMADYRAWQTEVRRLTALKSTAGYPAAAAAVTALRDNLDGAAAAAQLSGSADRGVLRSLEDCYYHPDRGQWVRLAEPASVLAVALQLMYGSGAPAAAVASPLSPGSPVASNNARSFPRRGSLPSVAPTTAGEEGTPSSPHVSFALAANTEATPVSNTPSSTSTTAAFNASSTSATGGEAPQLNCAAMTRDDALDVLRHGGRADASRPATLACSLRGYKPVLPPSRFSSSGGSSSSGLGSGAVSTVSALMEASATGASAIIGLGSGVVGGKADSLSSNNGGGGSSSGGGGGGGNSYTAAAELKVTVEVLFPHAFAALHVLYTDGAPLDFAAALLRSRPYMTDGGKSQARFFVTEDSRFLIKCIKPTELRYFKEWAPRYFQRMADYYASTPSQALFAEQSTLGKVLGLYVVHVQNSRSRYSTLGTAAEATAFASQTSQQQQQQQQHQTYLRSSLPDGVHCFMVAEQLLFQRPVRETWDLKGSQRNRTSEQTAAVRLDVDLVQERLRHGDFFFCSPESKSLLMDHLARDTQLLSDSGIMDYSLMASIGNGKLYVGMIDFLHPYSSAKVLESKMKSGLDTVFGYGRRDPTIIDPASYAARFMLWMDGYFNGVPDRLFPLTRVQLLAERKESAAAATRERVQDESSAALQ